MEQCGCTYIRKNKLSVKICHKRQRKLMFDNNGVNSWKGYTIIAKYVFTLTHLNT
jgi:hypothetical protein